MIELSPLDKERIEQIKQSAQLIINHAESYAISARYSKKLDIVIRLNYDMKPYMGIKFDEVCESVDEFEKRERYDEPT